MLCNAETLKRYNYVMFKNTNSPQGVWVYAFIAECNYINDNTTELILDMDIFQTYLFDMDLSAFVFVERRMVDDDASITSPSWLIPEPNLVGGDFWEYSEGYSYDYDGFKPDCIIIDTTADVHYGDIFGPTSVPTARKDIYGGKYSSMPTGVAKYAFTLDVSDEMGFARFLWDLNKVGAGDAVSDVFMYPSAFLTRPDNVNAPVGNGYWKNLSGGNYGDAWKGHRLASYDYVHSQEVILPFPSPSVDPDNTYYNKKCFHYPYCFLRVEAATGNYVDYKYEGFYEEPRFEMWCNPFATSNAVVCPRQYLGLDHASGYALTFPCNIRVPWVYGTFMNWSAQHAVSNAISFAADIAMIGIPAPQVKGAGAAVKALTSAGKVLKESSAYAKARGASVATQLSYGAASSRQYFRNTNPLEVGVERVGLSGELGSAAGILGLGHLASDISYNSMQPMASRGATDMPTIYNGNGYSARVRFKCMHMRVAFLKVYDNFFSMFGYAMNRSQQFTGQTRPLYSYWKTSGAKFTSIIDTPGLGAPMYVVDIFNAMFDNGVTLWHTTSGFGKYNFAGNQPT